MNLKNLFVISSILSLLNIEDKKILEKAKKTGMALLNDNSLIDLKLNLTSIASSYFLILLQKLCRIF